MTENNNIYRILLVDDEVPILVLLEKILEETSRFDCVVSTAKSADEAEKLLDMGDYDIIIADQKMPGKSGIELLAYVKNNSPDTVRMLITGYSDIDTAKEAINKADVHSFIEKPWDNDDLLKEIHENLEEKEKEKTKDNIYRAIDVREAISVIEETVEEELERIGDDHGSFQTLGKLSGVEIRKLKFEFDSVSDFNKFPFELKHLDPNDVKINIDDFRVYGDSFSVTVSLSLV